MEPPVVRSTQPAGGLLRLVRDKRILVTVGAGGVGKTTVAAAVGLLGARLGRRTLVMTIDPARRLADSLGLDRLDHEEREVPRDKLAVAGIEGGLLHAMMLDQKRTFDELIRRHAPDEAAVRRVMRNKLYHELSTRLAGGQEYAAMEKLHELDAEGRYDLIVLDTPPTANAIDFLEAPRKMVDMVDSPAVRIFVESRQKSGRFSIKALGVGAAYVFRRLRKFVGSAFLDDVAAFFDDMRDLLGGFRARAAEVLETLSRQDTAFLLVTSPDPRATEEAAALHARLLEARMRPSACVINRVHPRAEVLLPPPAVARQVEAAGLPHALAERLAAVLLRCHERIQALAAADAEQIQRLAARCGPAISYVPVPLFHEDIHDIAGLAALGDFLS